MLYRKKKQAQVLVETIARRIKGVIGNEESLENESHQKKLLEVDRYTRLANL